MNNNMDNLNQQDFQFLKEKLQSAVKEYLELDDVNMFLKHKCGFMLESSGTFVSLDDRIRERWSKA